MKYKHSSRRWRSKQIRRVNKYTNVAENLWQEKGPKGKFYLRIFFPLGKLLFDFKNLKIFLFNFPQSRFWMQKLDIVSALFIHQIHMWNCFSALILNWSSSSKPVTSINKSPWKSRKALFVCEKNCLLSHKAEEIKSLFCWFLFAISSKISSTNLVTRKYFNKINRRLKAVQFGFSHRLS